MNVLTRGVRNAFRNSVRTFSITIILGLSVGLALAMLIARGAVQSKIDSVKSSIGNTISVSPAGVQGFEGGGNPLTMAQIDSIKSLAHISSVSESLQDRLTTSNSSLVSAIDAGALGQRFNANNGERIQVMPRSGFGIGGGDGGGGAFMRSFTPPVTVTGTNDLATSNAASNGVVKLTSGKVFDAGSSDNVALIGKALAAKNNLQVGSTFTAYDTAITVAGIYDTGNTFGGNTVVMPLLTLQKLSSQTGDITHATVKVDTIANVSNVVTAIKDKLGDAADVTSDQSTAESALAPLENIKTVSLYSLIGSVVAGSVIILLTMIMIVRERRREIGVLKAIGASNVKVVTQFMAEAMTFTGLGAVIGVMLGVVGGSPITRVLVNNASSGMTAVGPSAMGARGGSRVLRGLGLNGQSLRDVHAAVGWEVLVYGLLAALIIAMVGSAFSAFLIAKVRPAEVMRVE
ncbi:MAG TPA: FtsX-like permease family protein [Candidatus Saccharimonadales bacterium]